MKEKIIKWLESHNWDPKVVIPLSSGVVACLILLGFVILFPRVDLGLVTLLLCVGILGTVYYFGFIPKH